MKLSHALWGHPRRVSMVERSDPMWSTGEGMANHFSILALRTPWTIWKGNMTGYWKRNYPGQQVPNMLLEISGEITPERMRMEKEMAIHSSTIPWKIPWTEELGRLKSMGLQRVRHDWATSHHYHTITKALTELLCFMSLKKKLEQFLCSMKNSFFACESTYPNELILKF